MNTAQQLMNAIRDNDKRGKCNAKMYRWLIKKNRVPAGVKITEQDGKFSVDFGKHDVGLV